MKGLKRIKTLKKFARWNRRRRVYSERVFLNALYDLELRPWTQTVIGGYIVVFFLLDRNLIIEIDGKDHLQKKEYDQKRDKFFIEHGFFVHHWLNEDIDSDVVFCAEQALGYQSSHEIYRLAIKRLKFCRKDYRKERKKNL